MKPVLNQHERSKALVVMHKILQGYELDHLELKLLGLRLLELEKNLGKDFWMVDPKSKLFYMKCRNYFDANYISKEILNG